MMSKYQSLEFSEEFDSFLLQIDLPHDFFISFNHSIKNATSKLLYLLIYRSIFNTVFEKPLNISAEKFVSMMCECNTGSANI
jgi:hypothetical protein